MLTLLPAMEPEAFFATRHRPTDAEWDELCIAFKADNQEVPARGTCHIYTDSFLIEERPDGFYPHAWWYSPVRYDTIEKAEKVLYAWRQEWV